MEGGGKRGKAVGDNAPVIVEHLQSATVSDGTAVNLSCRITGNNNEELKMF